MSYKIFLKLIIAATVSMVAGSTAVHSYYKPLSDLEDYIQIEIEKRKSKSGH